MFKTKEHILGYLLLIGLLPATLSCKSKKENLAAKDIPAEQRVQGKETNDVRFGYIFINACSERMKGNLQEALKLFEECKKYDPANPALRYELGMIYKLLGDNMQALANARLCAASDLKNEWYQLLLIDCYNAGKQYGQAIKVRETLIKNFPAKSEFKEDLAIEYAMIGEFEKSFKIYDELERTYGIIEQITLNKVKLLKSQKKMKEAEAELIRLSASDKKETRYYSYLAEFYMEQGALEKAKGMYDQILSIEPNNPNVNLALHDYYSAKNDKSRAYEHLKKAFLNPELEVETKTNIVGSYYKQAVEHSSLALQQGLELATIMLKIHPAAPEPNALYADFLILQNKTAEASVYYYLAATNNKRDYRVWQNLLYTDNELGQYDSLEHHSAIAMDYFPSQPECYLYNGVANSQLGNYKKAAQSLNDGLSFVVDNKAMALDFLRSLGDAWFHLNEYEKSEKAFEDALKIDPDNTYVLNNYAYYLSLRNTNLEKAEKFSKRTNELQPGNRSYMDTYGWILYQEKKYGEAEEWLSKAAKTGPKNPTILEHYGDLLYRLNKTEEALIQWNAAKQAGGNSETLLKKIKEKKLND